MTTTKQVISMTEETQDEIKRAIRDAVVEHYDEVCAGRHERSNAVAIRALELAGKGDRALAILVGDHPDGGRVGMIEKDLRAAHDGLRSMRSELAAGLDKIGGRMEHGFADVNKEVTKLTVKLAGAVAAATAVAKALGLI